MPFGLIAIALDVVCVVHAAKTGRFWPWAYVVLFLPGVGAVAYLLVEVLPGYVSTPAVDRAARAVVDGVAPLRRYKERVDALDVADTVANREALARECLSVGKPDEALTLYDAILASPQGDEPKYGVGRARALLALNRPDEAEAAIDRLRAEHPTFHSNEAHLLYARTLAATGRDEAALVEYDTLVGHGVGLEAPYRRAALLAEMGRGDEARAAAEEILRRVKRSPAHVKRLEAEWARAARRLAKP